MKKWLTLILLLCSLGIITARAGQSGSDERIKKLERKLDDATRRIEQLINNVENLRAEMSRLRGCLEIKFGMV